MGLFGANNTGTSSSGIKSETIGILKKKKNGLELKASSSWTDDEQDNNTTVQTNNKKVSSKTKFWRLHDDLAVENKAGDTSSSSPFQFRNDKVDSAGKTKQSQTKTKKGEKFQRLEGVGSGTTSPDGAAHSPHTPPNNGSGLGFRANHLKRPGSSAKKNKPARPLHTLPSVDEHKPSVSSNRTKPIKIPSLRLRKIQQVDSADSGAASFAEYQPPEFEFGDFGGGQDVAPQQTEPQRASQRASTANSRETQKFQSFLNEPLQPCFSEDTAEATEQPSDRKGDVTEIRPSESGSITHISEISGLYSESGFPTSKGGHNFQQIVFDKSFHEIKKVQVTQSDVGASDFSDFSAAAAKLTKELSKVGQKSKSSSCPKKKATETSPQRAHWPRLGEKKRDTPAYNRNTTTIEKHHTPMRRNDSSEQLSREERSVSLSLNQEDNVRGNVCFGTDGSWQAPSKAHSVEATCKKKSRNENEPPSLFPIASHREMPAETHATKSFQSTMQDTFTAFNAGNDSWNATKNATNDRQTVELRNTNDPFEFTGDSSWHTALSKPANSRQRGHTDTDKHGSVASRSIAFEAASRSVAFEGDGSWHKSRSLDEGGFSVISDLSGTQKGPFDQYPNERRDASQKRGTQPIPQDFREIQNSLFEPPTKPSTYQSPPPVSKAADALPFISGSSTPLDDMFQSSAQTQHAQTKKNLDQFNTAAAQEMNWDTGFDPFFNVETSRSAPKRSKNVTSSSSLDDGLIESIRSASTKKTRTDPEVGTIRKRDPSPKAVVMSSSDSALDQHRVGRSDSNKYSPGPQRIPPKAIPTNAILGSMLFRQSQSSNDSAKNESSDMNDVRESADETRDEVDAYGVPKSVTAARDDAESIVSSVTEEASSFYQKSFGGSSKNWNKSAHDLVSNYGVNRQNVREAFSAARTKANVTKGNLSRLEEEHVNVFLSEV